MPRHPRISVGYTLMAFMHSDNIMAVILHKQSVAIYTHLFMGRWGAAK